MTLPYSRSEVKERVRETWRGACNVTLPTFSEDFSGLNAGAIEHDVRLAADHGYWGTLVAAESGTTTAEYLQFMEIAAGAAPEGFRLVVHLSDDTQPEMYRVAAAAEALGFEAALPSYPASFSPTSSQQIVDHTRELAERTDLALILFAVETWGFATVSPEGFPHDAIAELADVDTVAAVKYEASSPGMIAGLADLRRRVGDRVLIQNPMEQNAPGLVDWYGMQWMGSSGYEAYGDRVPRWFAMLHEGRWDEAMELYWSYQPLRLAKGAFHKTFGGANLIHRNGWKYLSWLQGYNGGLLRMPQMRLKPQQMKPLRAAAIASGFDVPDDDEGFVRGRVSA